MPRAWHKTRQNCKDLRKLWRHLLEFDIKALSRMYVEEESNFSLLAANFISASQVMSSIYFQFLCCVEDIPLQRLFFSINVWIFADDTNIQCQCCCLLPLYTEGGEIEDWADDRERLWVVSHLAEGRPELPAEGEQLPHLQCDIKEN